MRLDGAPRLHGYVKGGAYGGLRPWPGAAHLATARHRSVDGGGALGPVTVSGVPCPGDHRMVHAGACSASRPTRRMVHVLTASMCEHLPRSSGHAHAHPVFLLHLTS